MGYFANGTEGMIFEENVCSGCVHGQDVDAPCPIWNLHNLWNYDQFPEHEKTPEGKAAAETKREALDTFIVETGGEYSDQECKMFHPVREVSEPEFRTHDERELVPLKR